MLPTPPHMEVPTAHFDGTSFDAAPLPDRPSSVVVSTSGGLDSAAAALWARWRWPDTPLIVWHAYLANMDWPQTDEAIDQLTERLGNARRVTVQAVYRLTGEQTRGGYNATTLARLHDVEAHGPAEREDEDEILDILEFSLRARKGQPPTSKNRHCTAYSKIQAYDAWARQNRAMLGSSSVLLSGERWAESAARSSRVQPWEWRDKISLKPGNTAFPDGWRHLWVRPVVAWKWHEVAQFVHDAGVPFHPGYFIQGETLEAMLDPSRDERKGRARLSCALCIFSRPQEIRRAVANRPDIMQPFIDRVAAYEEASGYTWQQRGPIHEIVQPPAQKPEDRQENQFEQLVIPLMEA